MIDREKVIKYLKAYVDCYGNRHSKCEPDCMLYGYGDCAKYAVKYISNALDLLKEQPEIVRCKDCKYWNEDDHDCNIKVGHFTAPPDWFCADGEVNQHERYIDQHE